MKRDRLMLAAMLALTVFGVAFQTRLAGGGVPSLTPLMLGLVAGTGLAIAFANHRAEALLASRWGKWLGWAGAVALMAALLVFGRRYRGGLYLPGRMNPSELVKFAMAFFLAGMLCAPARARMLTLLGAFGLVGALVAAAGDFGLAAQLALTLAMVLFLVSWWWGAAAFALVGGVFAFAFTHYEQLGHLAVRFGVWRDPFVDARGAGWQILQGLVAVASGGVWGQGFKGGSVENVPIVSSDFVYAALAADLGLVGCAVILGLWALVVARAFRAAAMRAAEGSTGEALMAAGIACSFAVQVVLNVAGVLKVLPMTGITLPLISHGGSSLVVTLAMCGALYSLSYSSQPLRGGGPARKALAAGQLVKRKVARSNSSLGSASR